MPEQHMSRLLDDGSSVKRQMCKQMAAAIEAGAQLMLEGITNGGKLWVAGSGACAALADYFVALLVGGYERRRPELPAMRLQASQALYWTLLAEGREHEAQAAQLRIAGRAGDVLILLLAAWPETQWQEALTAACELDMSVIALVGALNDAPMNLQADDVLLRIPGETRPLIHEGQVFALHCLCQALDHHLLGE